MAQTFPADVEAPEQAEELSLGLLADFLGPRVRVLWNLLSARMVEALAPFGLRPGAFSALALISANPGCSQKQLALQLRHGQIGGGRHRRRSGPPGPRHARAPCARSALPRAEDHGQGKSAAATDARARVGAFASDSPGPLAARAGAVALAARPCLPCPGASGARRKILRAAIRGFADREGRRTPG